MFKTFLTIESNPFLVARAQFLKFFYYIVSATILFYLVKNFFIYKNYGWSFVTVPCFIALIATPFIARITKSFEFAAAWCVSLATLELLLLMVEAGGIDAPGVIWLAAIPFSFGVLLGRKGILTGAIILVSEIVLFFVLKDKGYSGDIHFSDTEYFQEKVVNLITFSIYGILSILYFLKNEKFASQELENQKKSIESLLRILIHDVATPLSVSNMIIDRLARHSPDDAILRDLVGRLKASQTSANKILAEVRTLRAVNDGKLGGQLQTIDLVELTRDALNSLMALVEKKKINVRLDTRFKSILVQGEPLFYKIIVFSNLLTNAIKFSQENGEIVITLEDSEQESVVKVRDFGMGIPDNLLSKLWDDHAKTHRDGTMGEAGTGYGLPLVKEFSGKMKAKIEVRSSENNSSEFARGTEFTLRFPKNTSNEVGQ